MSLLKSNLGSHNCTARAKRTSDLAEYGVGTVLYFQMLKYLAFMFWVMFMLSIPSIIFFTSGTEVENASFSKIVSAASLGNLGSSEPVC